MAGNVATITENEPVLWSSLIFAFCFTGLFIISERVQAYITNLRLFNLVFGDPDVPVWEGLCLFFDKFLISFIVSAALLHPHSVTRAACSLLELGYQEANGTPRKLNLALNLILLLWHVFVVVVLILHLTGVSKTFINTYEFILVWSSVKSWLKLINITLTNQRPFEVIKYTNSLCQ